MYLAFAQSGQGLCCLPLYSTVSNNSVGDNEGPDQTALMLSLTTYEVRFIYSLSGQKTFLTFIIL